MKWHKPCGAVYLFCKEASREDISAIVRKTEAFLSGCKSISPGVRRELEDGLTNFIRDLKTGAKAAPILKLNAIKFLLRWCVTDGRHLQDFRKDNARALWRVLFRGAVPDFYRYDAQTGEYREDVAARDRWVQAQIDDCHEHLSGQMVAELTTSLNGGNSALES
jgi:hypothetical protein